MQKLPQKDKTTLLFEKRTVAELSEMEMTQVNGGSLPVVAVATIGLILILPPFIEAVKDMSK